MNRFGLMMFLSMIMFAASGDVATCRAQQPATAPPLESPARTLVVRYCVECHNNEERTAGLALDDVSAVVGRINARYANVETGWQPIHLIMGENYPRALAAMKWYDVLLVNSIIDGMNLVAKEGALLNERNGVLVLSEGAGAVSQLGEHALIIGPTDVEGTAETLNLDFSSTYNFNDNFSVSLEALNLTDEVQDQWVDSIGDRLSFYHHQGTQYYVGVRWKY